MTIDPDSLPDATDSSPETPSEISFPQELLEAIPADKRDEFRQKYGRLFLEVRKRTALFRSASAFSGGFRMERTSRWKR